MANGARVAYMRDEGTGAEEADLEVDFGHLGLSRPDGLISMMMMMMTRKMPINVGTVYIRTRSTNMSIKYYTAQQYNLMPAGIKCVMTKSSPGWDRTGSPQRGGGLPGMGKSDIKKIPPRPVVRGNSNSAQK